MHEFNYGFISKLSINSSESELNCILKAYEAKISSFNKDDPVPGSSSDSKSTYSEEDQLMIKYNEKQVCLNGRVCKENDTKYLKAIVYGHAKCILATRKDPEWIKVCNNH